VIFFDGSGDEHVCEIVSLTSTEVQYRVRETRSVRPHSGMKLCLAVSLIKKDNFEWVIQKGTELGVAEFVPLISERSEKKGFNIDRARRIMIEAVEQSGRADLPTIAEPVVLDEFLGALDRKAIAFHTDGKKFDRAALPVSGDLVAFIGPEGGWSDKEVSMFREKGIEVAKLDTPVLRAETAAVAIATLLLAA
jgi:16S rRNA (uracil1498-N3)-methyltransferase